MSSWIDFFYFFISGVAMVLSVLGLWFTAIMPGIDRWSRRFFLGYFNTLMICCLSGSLEVVFYYYPVPISAIYFVMLLESLLLSLPLPMLTVYLLHCCGENMRSNKLLHIVLFLLGIHIVQLAIIPFNNIFFYAVPDGRWERGVFYPFLILPLDVIMLLNLAGTIKFRKQMSHKTVTEDL